MDHRLRDGGELEESVSVGGVKWTRLDCVWHILMINILLILKIICSSMINNLIHFFLYLY